jgi:hypothetical protein
MSSLMNIDALTVAEMEQWFDDCSEDIRSICDKALQMLRTQYGWEVSEVSAPQPGS